MSRCRDCHNPIIWLETDSGTNCAVEPEDQFGFEVDENETYDPDVHQCHWDLCEYG